MLHAAASILARDGAVALTGRRLSARREMVAIRVGVVAVMVLAYGLAVIYQGSLVELLLWAYGPVVQFAPVLVATLYWRRARGSAVLAGLVVGSCVNLVLVLQPDWRPIAVHAGLYGLVVNVSILVAGSLVQEGPSDETFLEVASGGPAA
jgi:SSS family solute:Na+ symporter